MTIVGAGHLTMLDVAPPQWVTLCHDAGFDAVGIRVLAAVPTESQWPMHTGSPMLAETLLRMGDLGTLVLEVELIRLTADTRPADYLPLVESGAELGASFINVMVDDDERSRIRDNMSALAQISLPYGMRPAIEAIPYMRLPNLQAAVDAVSGTGAGVIIDPLHLRRSGQTVDDVRALDPSLLAYFQLCDAPLRAPENLPRPDHLPAGQSLAGGDLALESRAMRLLPGDGELPLAELIAAKPVDMPLSVEAPGLPLRQSIGDAEFMRRARLSVDRVLSSATPHQRSA
jgi:sugar phosphate isomerase/epimerase